jgi:hypothetical protein
MSVRDITIHIGLPKTGTTLLQTRVFPNHPQIAYLGRGGICPEMDELLRVLRRSPTWDGGAARLVLQSVMSHMTAADRAIVVSHEGLSTHTRSVSPSLKAQRLHELFGRARVLLIVRRPQDMIESLYFQRLKRPWHRTFDLSFERWFERQWTQRDIVSCELQRLLFFSLATSYADVFGRDNVIVLPYELLQRDTDCFCAALAVELGVELGPLKKAIGGPKVNPRHTSLDLWKVKLLRWIPWLDKLPISLPVRLKGLLRSGQLGQPIKLTFPTDIEERIIEFSTKQCTALDQAWGLNLGSYGYPIEAEKPSPHCTR